MALGARPGSEASTAELIEAELKSFCRAGELVYAAIIDSRREIEYSICMVGARPHNEVEIAELVSAVFTGARALGGEIGERAPLGLMVQGTRWGYFLDLLDDGRLLFGVFPGQALPAIVRACAQRTRAALGIALAGAK